jgi:hypothetical protein
MSGITRRRVMEVALAGKAAGGELRQSKRDVNPQLFTFVGGKVGDWSVVEMKAVVGNSLGATERLAVVHGDVSSLPDGSKWALRGVTSNVRYVTRAEIELLNSQQADLGRPQATCAALIPIRKTAEWWSMPQDERRRIFEEGSHHVKTGLQYLPAIARRLHHCRDLGVTEPFDFLTWFDYAPEHAEAFEELVGLLRATEEWNFVEREVDIRLAR